MTFARTRAASPGALAAHEEKCSRVPSAIGKYYLGRELGHGGMGTVWEAYDPQLQRRVAIKLISGLDTESSNRLTWFEREAQAVARLQNPHVVQIYDYGVTEEGKPYMVMEMLEGETLDQRLKRTRTMTPAAFLPILTQIAKALEAAHAAGIIHCDLKPGNIFLTHLGVDVTVKILDFGIAAMRDERSVAYAEHTPQYDRAGTPPYMSPEQINSIDLDYRTDLWSLAVIAYEALTGQLPFGTGIPSSVFMRVCLDPFAPPSSIRSGLNSALDAFFARALAKNPNHRFSSARELATAFAELAREVSTRPTKILVVDDEPDLALLLEQYFQPQLEAGRYQFFFAGNGIEGLQALHEHPDVDIALTDLRMPGMDGLTFLGKMGAVAPALRTIVISAYSDMGNIRQAMNSGAFDFLIKPFDFDDLESTIEKAAREVRNLRRALQSMEENEALRMFVDPAVRERLLPILRMSGCMAGERMDGTVAIICIHDHQHIDDARSTVEQLNHAYDDIVPVLEMHQGTVAHFLGDRLLALFHSADHGERAALACIEVRTRLELTHATHALRIGLASGPVMTGSVGAPSKHRFDYAVFGETVQAANVLERLAEPGQILVDDSLHQVLRARFCCEPICQQGMPGTMHSRAVFNVVTLRQDVPTRSMQARTLPLD